MCGNYGARPGQHSALIAVKRGGEQVALHPVRFHAFSDTRSLYYSNSAPRPFPTRRPPWIPPPPPPPPPPPSLPPPQPLPASYPPWLSHQPRSPPQHSLLQCGLCQFQTETIGGLKWHVMRSHQSDRCHAVKQAAAYERSIARLRRTHERRQRAPSNDSNPCEGGESAGGGVRVVDGGGRRAWSGLRRPAWRRKGPACRV